MDSIVTVAIVDDHKIARIGVDFILNNLSFVKVVGEAANSHQLFELLKTTSPDIIFMDLRLGQESGVDITRIILAKYPDIRVIALTMTEEIKYFTEMMEAGAYGYMLKNVNEQEFENAITDVMNGKHYFSKEYLTFSKQLNLPEKNENQIHLSEREQQVLELICKGYSNNEIASELELSYHTIDSHRRSLMHKTGARNMANLVMTAIKQGLVKNI